jgi:mono/diheme cytochrome c family protein
MKTLVRWTARIVGAMLGLVALIAIVLYFLGGARLGRTYDLEVPSITVRTDSTAVARGRHLAEAVTLCQACHGEDLGGGVIFDEPLIASVYASNLTTGLGGVGGSYSDQDLVRAIREGVGRDGRGLMIMHSDAFHNLGEDDLGALIAYVKSAPPVDREQPLTRASALGKVMVALGLFDSGSMPLIAAEVIDHDAPIAQPPERGVSVEYGGYLVSIAVCRMCHGTDFSGGPPIEEGAPPAPSLAAYGLSDGWSAEQFIATLRTGVNPGGRALDEKVMPWKVYGHMTDEELAAIQLYLASVIQGAPAANHPVPDNGGH